MMGRTAAALAGQECGVAGGSGGAGRRLVRNGLAYMGVAWLKSNSEVKFGGW